MSRLFIAVRFTPTDALLSARAELDDIGPPVRVVSAEQLHITLRFLGAVDPAIEPLLVDAMIQSVADTNAFDMPLHGVGAFPKPARPSVVWAGATDDQPLHGIVESLSNWLATLDITPDPKPWKNHVTLARVKSKPPVSLFDWFDRHRLTPFGVVRVSAIDLMASELHPTGAVHTLCHSVALPDATQAATQ